MKSSWIGAKGIDSSHDARHPSSPAAVPGRPPGSGRNATYFLASEGAAAAVGGVCQK